MDKIIRSKAEAAAFLNGSGTRKEEKLRAEDNSF